MDVIAKLRFYRQTPRKVRSVLRLLPGKPVEVAEAELAVLPRAASGPLIKLLKSAVANASHNFKLKTDGLRVKQAFADEGPKIKRFRPAAYGMAHPILKRMSHVTIILTDGSSTVVAPVKGKKLDAPVRPGKEHTAPSRKRTVAKDSAKPAVMEKKDEKEMPHKDVIRRGEN